MARLPLLVCVGWSMAVVAACSRFGEADIADDGGTDAGTGAETALVDSDASPALSIGCLDLTAGANQFAPYADPQGGSTSVEATGLTVAYPASSKVVAAAWRRSFKPPSSARGAKLTIVATVSLPAGSFSRDWYAGLGTLINGTSDKIDAESSVHLVVGDESLTTASVSIDTFPIGTATGPSSTTKLGSISGSASITATLDVTWSTSAATNIVGQLADEPSTPVLDKATLSGPIAPLWSVSLGGAAERQPAMSITYKKVCLEFHD